MLRSVLFTILMVFSASAAAEGFDYTYFSVGYQRLNFDGGGIDADGDGFGVDGAFEINESFFLTGSYGTGEVEEAGIDVDIDTLSAGIGWHTPMTEAVDFVATLTYEWAEASAFGFSADDTGIGLGAGLRFQASDAIEINGGLNYVDFGDGGDDTSFGLGLLYGVSETVDIGVSGEWGDDVSAYGLSGRFYFGG